MTTRPAQDETGAISRGRVSLRALRRARRWTQQDLSRAFEMKSREFGRPLSLSVRQIRRWESVNPPWPLPAYQRILEALFDLPVTAMGFVPCWPDADAGRFLADDDVVGSDAYAVSRNLAADAGSVDAFPAGTPFADTRAEGADPGTFALGAATASADPAGDRPEVWRRTDGCAADRPGGGAGGAVCRGDAAEDDPYQDGLYGDGGLGGEADGDGDGGSDAASATPEYRVDAWDADFQKSFPEAIRRRSGPGEATLGEPFWRSAGLDALVRSEPSPLPPRPDRTAQPEREDPLERRQFVTGALAVTSAIAVEATAGSAGAASATAAAPAVNLSSFLIDTGTATPFARITEEQRQLYWVLPAPAFYSSVETHAALGGNLLAAASGPSGRRLVASAAAETSMLAARIAFFDLQSPENAGPHYERALVAARQAGDPLLTSAILAHLSFIPAYQGKAAPARRFIAAAHAFAARGGASPTMRSWLYAVEAEVEAKVGNGRGSLALIAKAEESINRAGADEDPPWLDFFDRARLAGYRGFSELAAGRPVQARAALAETYDGLAPNAVKQRAVCLADIAATYAREGEVDEACAVLGRALEILEVHWYATAHDRVRSVRTALEPYRTTRPVRFLDQTLSVFRRQQPSS